MLFTLCVTKFRFLIQCKSTVDSDECILLGIHKKLYIISTTLHLNDKYILSTALDGNICRKLI